MDGKKQPRCLLVQPAMLEAPSMAARRSRLMLDLLAKADSFEKEPGIDVVSIQGASPGLTFPIPGRRSRSATSLVRRRAPRRSRPSCGRDLASA